MDRLWKIISSLRLTVVLLIFSMLLVFFGTLAQVKIGLYEAQTNYFRSLFVMWTPGDSEVRIPVLPGGYLLGWALFVNLVAAHVKRFTLTRKKIGIFTIHAGLILLLLGQFFTEIFQVEGTMRIEEGGSKNYSASHLDNELVVIDRTDSGQDRVIAFPGGLISEGAELSHPEVPFTVKVKKYVPNSDPELMLYARQQDQGIEPHPTGEALSTPNGVGRRLTMVSKPVTAKMDDRNFPTAIVEISRDGESKGEWLVTNWAADDALAAFAERVVGARYGNLGTPQEFEIDGKTYAIALRSERYYKAHTIHLLDFAHDKYKGTDIPKNFSSRIRLENPETGEDRELTIRMNEPLRYAGETYYQSSFEPGDQVTVLQVVRNPVWLTPYVSCFLVGLGLVIQFGQHLIKFGKKRRKQADQDKSGGAASGKGRPGSAKNKPKQRKKAAPVPAAVPRTATGGSDA